MARLVVVVISNSLWCYLHVSLCIFFYFYTSPHFFCFFFVSWMVFLWWGREKKDLLLLHYKKKTHLPFFIYLGYEAQKKIKLKIKNKPQKKFIFFIWQFFPNLYFSFLIDFCTICPSLSQFQFQAERVTYRLIFF